MCVCFDPRGHGARNQSTVRRFVCVFTVRVPCWRGVYVWKFFFPFFVTWCVHGTVVLFRAVCVFVSVFGGLIVCVCLYLDRFAQRKKESDVVSCVHDACSAKCVCM